MASAPIRILHFTYALEGGGAERQLKHLVEHLDRDALVSAVCCADAGGVQDINSGVSVFEIPRKGKLHTRWRSMTALMKRWQPHVVHCWPPVVLWPTVPLAQLLGVGSVIASYRNVYQVDSVRRLVQFAGFWFADLIVTNTPPIAMNPLFRRLFECKSGEYIPNGIALDAIQTAQPARLASLGLSKGVPTLLYAGRLVSHKNVAALIDAVGELRARGLPVELLICGDGPERQELAEQAGALGIRKHISFAGYRRDLYSIMKKCTALIHPSRREGMPNVVFEAAAAGLPIVASDICVHRYWLRDREDALLFDPSSPLDLADSVQRILNEPETERRRRVRNAKQLTSTLTIQEMTRLYTRLYTRLTRDDSPRGQAFSEDRE